jgi:hypothetical protein
MFRVFYLLPDSIVRIYFLNELGGYGIEIM